MALCAHCGKKTSWRRRVRVTDHEFCGRECAELWTAEENKRRKEQQKREKEEEKREKQERRRQREESKRQREREKAERKRREEEREREEEDRRRKEEEAAAAEWHTLAKGYLEGMEANPQDPYAYLEYARFAKKNGHLEEAEEAYVKALSLGIPSLRDSGLARWDYSNLWWLINRQRIWQWSLQYPTPGSLGNTATFERAFREPKIRRHFRREAADVIYRLTEAERDLRRALKSSPDDLHVLTILRRICVVVGKPQAPVEEQIKQLRARRLLSGGAGGRLATRSRGDRSGLQFENLCLSLVKRLGFRAELTQATADGGIDIIAFQDQPLLRGKYVIQCKDWQNAVGEPVLRDLLGAVAAEDAVKGILITSSDFTQGAKRFAEGKRLELIDGRDLHSLTAQLRHET